MASGEDLSGTWAGHYEQHGRVAPIRAELLQRGERLEGTMRDEVERTDLPLDEVVAEAGLPPGADETLTARLREMFPEEAGAPIRAVSLLPPESVLEGRVSGGTVEFVKTYRGEHVGGFRVGDHMVVERIEGHAVRYRGRLGPDGREIEGFWSIDPRPGQGGIRQEGPFLLRREG